MEILVLSACGLVANQYMRLKSKTVVIGASDENKDLDEEINHKEIEEVEEEQQQQQQQQQQHKQPPVGVTADMVPARHHCTASSPAPIPLGVRTLKTDNTADIGYDEARYNEQYSHPQDPNPNVSEKPWMRMANAPYKPKEEIVSEIPGPQDVFGRNMISRVKQMESDFAASTVPITSEKQFDRPVEQISTGNGSAVGFHIGSGRRFHKFLLNDQPTIESDGGPRGAFSGASASHVKGDYRTVTQRSTLDHQSVGPPVAVGVPQSSAPVPSFEITASHLESYRLDDHLAKSSRAPVQASASTDTVSFRGAYDEKLEVLNTSLVTGGERFATGASGTRDTKIHVPLNNDPVATYEQRVVPNFKIAKASDYHDQQVTARQMMIPEMSQNVSALRKDRKPPVSGSTTNKSTSFALETAGIKSGAAVRGPSFLPVKNEADAFRVPTDRKEVVAEKAARVALGASTSHAVGNSAASPSIFRTTQSVSELVGTPFIRGAGTKHASNLEPLHEDTDTHLSEMEQSGILRGSNRVSTSTAHSSVPQEKLGSTQERGDIFKKTERDAVLVAPGLLGSNRTGAANLHVDGMISRRGLEDEEEEEVNVMRSGKINHVRFSKDSKQTAGVRKDITKNRKLGDVLNGRMRSSSALKKLLENPYSLPAASRLPLL
ncbi:unnamed protein product [Ectocarpus sp. 12 AP-2014]